MVYEAGARKSDYLVDMFQGIDNHVVIINIVAGFDCADIVERVNFTAL